MATHFIEHCRVQTQDGVELDGAWHPAEADLATSAPVDAFLLVHGTGSNFYAPGMLETFAQQACAAGIGVLRVNTRGHDGMCSLRTSQGSARGGAAFEVIDECRYDLAAWIALLVARGCQRIALVGHSMGGVKSVYLMAKEPPQQVACLIGISPPRFCHARLMAHPAAEPFRADYQRASELVERGAGEQLLAVRQPLPLILTAGGFVAKYGAADDYDVVKHLANVACPTLIVIGGESVATSPAFAGLPEAVRDVGTAKTQIALQLVPGANTGYTGCSTKPFELVHAWLSQMVPQAGAN